MRWQDQPTNNTTTSSNGSTKGPLTPTAIALERVKQHIDPQYAIFMSNKAKLPNVNTSSLKVPYECLHYFPYLSESVQK